MFAFSLLPQKEKKKSKRKKKSANVKHFNTSLEHYSHCIAQDILVGTGRNKDEWIYCFQMNTALSESYKSSECSRSIVTHKHIGQGVESNGALYQLLFFSIYWSKAISSLTCCSGLFWTRFQPSVSR